MHGMPTRNNESFSFFSRDKGIVPVQELPILYLTCTIHYGTPMLLCFCSKKIKPIRVRLKLFDALLKHCQALYYVAEVNFVLIDFFRELQNVMKHSDIV